LAGPDDHKDVTGIARDPALLEAFYRRNIEAVGRFVARRTDDPHTAADLTAEVFLAALSSAEGYRGGPSLEKWCETPGAPLPNSW
jgi:DNA-directed RNA polymerase specialized sigma24 family protein